MYNDSHLLDFDRAGKITASLVAAIMGIDPYTSRQEAWRRIMGTAKPMPDNPMIRWGVDHEVDALEAFEIESGILIIPGQFISHPSFPWLGASPDGLTVNGGEPVEVKCPVKLHSQIPDHYKLQVLTQIECCNAEQGFFGSWQGEQDALGRPTEPGFWWTPVPADKKYFREIVCKELEMFYNEYVLTNTIPPRRSRKNAASI